MADLVPESLPAVGSDREHAPVEWHVEPFDTSDDAQAVLRRAVTSRLVEEALLDMFSRGKLHGTVHTCIGQELTGAVIAACLKPGDTIFSNHRCHGHFLSRNDDVEGLICELMGRATGVSGGLGGSQHLYKDGFYSNGIQGGIAPVATGLAMGHQLDGGDAVSVVFIGDGTLGEGALYEALNIASKWSLPLLLVLEDNKYSQSTAQHETLAGDIRARAAAFGIETEHATTWEWRAFMAKARGLVASIRQDRRPRFLHVETYRLKAHSKGDDTRPADVVQPFEKLDPLNRYFAEPRAQEEGWIAELRERIRRAESIGDQAPHAELLPLPAPVSSPARWVAVPARDKARYVTALAATFNALMVENERIIMIGEDILSPYGGAFKATNGLSQSFPGRVRNAPISESAIVGIGNGLALAGYRPIVEIMFGDFIGLAFDQIVNHAAKFVQMYNGQVQCDLIVRTPMGGGRGYGPTHSQTLDRHFFGVPGLRIVALNGYLPPESVYRPLMEPGIGPTLVIENKLLYSSYFPFDVPDGFELLQSEEKFPTLWLKPQAERCDVTLVGYGGTVEMLATAVDRLFEEHDIVAQLLAPTQIYPFSVAPYAAAIAAAGRLLVVEEGQGFAAFGSELISQLGEFDLLDGLQVRRIAPPVHCIPSSGPLEKAILPSVDAIVAKVVGWISP